MDISADISADIDLGGRQGRYVVRSHLRPWGRRWTFSLAAPNGEVVAVSEPYNSHQAALDGIEAVRRYAPGAVVVTE